MAVLKVHKVYTPAHVMARCGCGRVAYTRTAAGTAVCDLHIAAVTTVEAWGQA